MLSTVHKPCHVLHVWRITSHGKNFTEIFFGVSKERARSSSHAFVITNVKTSGKKLFAVRSEKGMRRKKENKLEWQLQSFLL